MFNKVGNVKKKEISTIIHWTEKSSPLRIHLHVTLHTVCSCAAIGAAVCSAFHGMVFISCTSHSLLFLQVYILVMHIYKFSCCGSYYLAKDLATTLLSALNRFTDG